MSDEFGHFEKGRWVKEPAAFHVWDIKTITLPATNDHIQIVELNNGSKVTIDTNTFRGKMMARQLSHALSIYRPGAWGIE